MRKIFYILAISLLFGQCLEPFDFDPREGDVESIVVIDGQLTDSNGPHFVRISTTRAFGEKFRVPIRDAQVKLIAPEGIIDFEENAEGDYELQNYKGEVGEEYAIEVRLPTGETYKSKPAIMPAVIEADSAYHSFSKDIVISSTGFERIASVLNVFVDSDLPNNGTGEATYMRWYTDELYIFAEEPCGGLHQPKACYITIDGNPQNIALFNSENIDGNRISGLKVNTKNFLPNYQFKTALFFSVYQYVIDKDAHDYWERLKSLTTQSGTVFDLPPASLIGNIENVDDASAPVLGYFELATTDTIRTKVFNWEYQENVNRIVYCSQFNRRNWPEECCQCLVLENASTERPAWLD